MPARVRLQKQCSPKLMHDPLRRFADQRGDRSSRGQGPPADPGHESRARQGGQVTPDRRGVDMLRGRQGRDGHEPRALQLLQDRLLSDRSQ